MFKRQFDKIKLSARLWLARRLPGCKEIVPMMSKSMDEPLSLRDRITVRLHLLTCRFCVRYLQQLKFMSDLMHECGTETNHNESPVQAIKMSSDARERIRHSLENKQK